MSKHTDIELKDTSTERKTAACCKNMEDKLLKEINLFEVCLKSLSLSLSLSLQAQYPLNLPVTLLFSFKRYFLIQKFRPIICLVYC